MLLEAAADSYKLEKTYDEWLEVLTSSIEKIRSNGIEPLLVDVDIKDLTAFCRERGLQNNGESRSMFIAERAKNMTYISRSPKCESM